MNRSWQWALIAVLAAVAASCLLYNLLRPEPLPAGVLYGSGHIEGTEIRVASEVGGRVLEQQLAEGHVVSAGAALVTVDPTVSRERLDAAAAQADGLRASNSALEAQIATWTHHLETARSQLARLERLAADKLASDQALDTGRDAVRAAEGELQRLRAQRRSLDEEITAADARLATARTELARTTVYAPHDGTVLVRAVEVGEVIQAGQPLALLVDLTRLELKVYLDVADLGKIRLGDEARIRVDAYPDQLFAATVARVDDYAQFTPRDIHVPDERTQMVYGITLALDNADGRLKPGMPADAWIRVDDVSWPDRLPVPSY